MIKTVLRSILNQKAPTLLFVLGLVLVFTTFPIALVSLKDAMVQIEDDITNYARGSYDILVRPSGSRTEIEKNMGVVEENYLSAGNGGISLREWRKLQEMEDIEIAAPVSSLGYFTGESRTFNTWMPEQSIRVQSKFFTSDGVHKYPIDKEVDSVSIMIEQEGKPQVVPDFEYFSKNNAVSNYWGPPSFMLPNTYHLMVGIDPESEEKLTGISFEQLKDNKDFDKASFEFAGDAPIIPIMKLNDPKVPIETVISWEELDIRKEQTAQWKNELGVNQEDSLIFADEQKYSELFDELIKYQSSSLTEYSFDFREVLKPFQYEPFMISKDLTLLPNDGGYMGSLSSTSKFYSSSPIDYEMNQIENKLVVSQIGNYKDIPTYRKIEEKGGTFFELNELPFVLNPSGEYTVSQNVDSLSASPLGLYQLAPITLIEDENGHKLKEPVELYSTIYPGSFVASPAHGVINLTYSEIIKGNTPIDAIRIRVSGISQYDQNAQDKIEQVAKHLLMMGYEVDIVAGASYQKMDVFVEGLGTVSQPWTTLGAAASIINGWSGTTFILSILFGITAVIYIWNHLFFFRERKATEGRLLLQFGWEISKVKKMTRMELVLLVLFSWFLSSLCILLYYRYINISVTTLISLLLCNLILIGIGFIFIIGATEWGWAKLLESKRVPKIKANSSSQNLNLSSEYLLAFRSIRYFKRYIISPFIQIILVSALSVLVYLSLNSTAEQTSTTMLGQYVNFQVNSLHFIILGSSYILAIITLIESISSLFVIRRSELGIFQSFGWKSIHIYIRFLREFSIWTSVTIIVGHTLGFVIYLIFFPYEIVFVQKMLISMVIFFGTILLIGIVILHRCLKQGYVN